MSRKGTAWHDTVQLSSVLSVRYCVEDVVLPLHNTSNVKPCHDAKQYYRLEHKFALKTITYVRWNGVMLTHIMITYSITD